MALYDLSEASIAKEIQKHIESPDKVGTGRIELVSKDLESVHGYPIKIVFSFEDQSIIVITAYPLRKGVQR